MGRRRWIMGVGLVLVAVALAACDSKPKDQAPAPTAVPETPKVQSPAPQAPAPQAPKPESRTSRIAKALKLKPAEPKQPQRMTPNAPPGYTLGGSVTGMGNGVLTLQNQNGDRLDVKNDGNFTFPTPLANAAGYAVTISTQPVGHTCSLSGGSGTIQAANVNSVSIACDTNTYAVGGTISGLAAGESVTLANGEDMLTVQGPSPAGFTFPTAVKFGSKYMVIPSDAPEGKSCSVRGGYGKMPAAPITAVTVQCAKSRMPSN